jgi:class 3 adenylate cyclase
MRDDPLHSILELQKTGQLNRLIQRLERLLQSELEVARRAEVLRHLGVAQTDHGDYARGERTLETALESFQKLGYLEKVAICQAEQALNYSRQGGDKNQTQALALLQKAGETLAQAEGKEGQTFREVRAKVTFYQAGVQSRRGEREAAYYLYQKALELYANNPWELAKVYDSFGTYYTALGRTNLARFYYEKSVGKKEEAGDQFGLCITYSNLGRLLLENRNFEEARIYFYKALDTGQKIHNHQGVAIYLNELGRVLLHLRRVDKAIEVLTQCLEHCKRKYPQTRAFAYKNLAKACLRQDNPKEGVKYIRQSLTIFQRLRYAEGIGVAKRTEGKLLEALREYGKASHAFQSAIKMFRQVHRPRGLAVTLIDFARVQQQLGQKGEAFNSLKQALQISEGVNDDPLVQKVQDELHKINPIEAMKIAVQRQVGKEAAAMTASLVGHEEFVTVLFSDIKDFTRFSANKTPRQVVETLNDYFWEMTNVVMEYYGYIDKFIGDGLMVIFRGSDKGYHARRAVSAGLKMLERLGKLNRDRRRIGLEELQIRIGIHSGEVIIGNIGSYEKMDYTAIGSTVNLAQRLEGYARPNMALISKSTYQQVGGYFTCHRRVPFVPKGFQDEIESWEVTGTRDLLRCKPVFVGHGEVVEPQLGVIALEVGSKVVPGIIDHHQGEVEKECTASLIYRYPHLVLDHKGIEDIRNVKIVLHEHPDFDSIVAVYFIQHLVEKGVLPTGARELSEYTKLVDSSMLPKTERPWNTPYGILQGIFEKNRRYCKRKGLSKEVRDLYSVRRGLYLMEYLCLRIAEGFTLNHPNLFEEDYPFEQERKLIREDYTLYLKDLKKAKKSAITLPLSDGNGEKEVDMIAIKDPQSILFRDWARGDFKHSRKGEGFALIMTSYHNKRYIISVDPTSGVTLKGLGASLELAETEKRKQLGKERPIEPQRPGYDNSDPWYDGRAPLFNYTIVDTPRGGTVLTAKEIREIVENPKIWKVNN